MKHGKESSGIKETIIALLSEYFADDHELREFSIDVYQSYLSHGRRAVIELVEARLRDVLSE